MYNNKPASLNELKVAVQNCAEGLGTDMIKKSVRSILRRMEACVKNGGSHFESEL